MTGARSCCFSGCGRSLRRTFCTRSLARRLAPVGRAPPPCGGSCLSRQARAGRGHASLLLQGAFGRARASLRWRLALAGPVTASIRALGAPPRPLGRLPALRRWQIHAGSPCFRQSDGDRLFRRTCAVLALADMMNLFAHVLTCLGRRRLALGLVACSPRLRSFLRHESPPRFFGGKRAKSSPVKASVATETFVANFPKSDSVTSFVVNVAESEADSGHYRFVTCVTRRPA
jgi:hypothetical protein